MSPPTQKYSLRSADDNSVVTIQRSTSLLCLTVHRRGREVTCAFVSVGLLGKTISATQPPSHLQLVGATWSLAVHRQGNDGFSLNVTRKRSRSDETDAKGECGKPPKSSAEVEVMFGCGGKGGWFGLGHLMYQHWPLEKGNLEVGPLYPFDNGPTGVCTVVVPAFMSVGGLMVSVKEDEKSCLHAGLNATVDDHKRQVLKWGVGVANFDRKLLPVVDGANGSNGDGFLRIQARDRYDGTAVTHPLLGWESKVSSKIGEDKVLENVGEKSSTDLTIQLVATENAKSAYEAFIKSIPWVPKDAPPVNMMRNPIWTTWAKYKSAVTQEDVLNFAREIVKNNLPRSVMEIDDRWSVKYGDLEFDREKFPDPKGMVDTLHHLGFQVTLWVIPFAERDSKAIRVDAEREESFFVQDSSGKIGFFDWWQPTQVAALDVTKKTACFWFLNGLYRLQSEYGIDGFKFDAGEPSFLPKDLVTAKHLSTPSDYTRFWVHRVASKFALSEVRSGVLGCQSARPMFRLFDRFSTWGYENGLRSVIPALLTSGILGFPFVLPDMVGGNVYGEEVPDFELMVRWAQSTAAMPAVQFSVPPWDFGERCISLFKDVLRWREEYFWPKIEALSGPAAKDGLMICRPMWYAEPERADAVDICDQFLLGDDVVVAPVVYEKQRKRRVYLPTGTWKRVYLGPGDIAKSQENNEGPVWLENVSANLEELPCFERVPDYCEGDN